MLQHKNPCHGDELPFVKHMYTTSEVQKLFKTRPKNLLCKKHIVRPKTAGTFLVDLLCVPLKDIRQDGYGRYKHQGCSTIKGTDIKRVYHHFELPDGNRLTRVIMHNNSPSPNTAIVNYAWLKAEVLPTTRPHGNRKHGNAGFVTTLSSVKACIDSNSKSMKAKQALGETQKLFPITEAPSAAAVPRNIRQAKYSRTKALQQLPPYLKESIPRNEFHQLILDMKRGTEQCIRSINQTPDSSMVVIGSDDQINLLRKCCVRDKAVLNIDPTFNLGPFEVTSLTFKNTLLRKNHNTDGNSSPIILGPAMIHTKKDRKTYEQFFFILGQLCPELKQTGLIIGTDGEQALFQAAKSQLKVINHLRCFRHVRQNIQSIAGDGQYWTAILGTHNTRGLVDCADAPAMEQSITALQSQWADDINGQKVSDCIILLMMYVGYLSPIHFTLHCRC